MDSLESLEKFFQKIEEDSERRAEENYDDDDVAMPGTTTKGRRRASITISRFGQTNPETVNGLNIPPRPNILSAVATQSTFYRAQFNNRSDGSIASSAGSEVSGEQHTEDDHRVTQVETIAGRRSISKTIGGILSRRLTRTRSASTIRRDTDLVIGVSVQEEIVESPVHVEATREATAYSPRLRIRHSMLSVPTSPPTRNSWIARVKSITRRKDKAHGFPTAPTPH